MLFLKIFGDVAKKSIRRRVYFKEMLSEAQQIGRSSAGAEDDPAVSSDVGKEEFAARYARVVFSCRCACAVLFVSLAQAVLAATLQGFMFCALLVLICGMFYFKYAFTAWRARKIYARWDQRGESVSHFYSEYISEIMCNWKELMPLRLEK